MPPCLSDANVHVKGKDLETTRNLHAAVDGKKQLKIIHFSTQGQVQQTTP